VSGASGAGPDRRGRPEDDDHDLLTFGEAGARLAEEIEHLTAELEALEEASFYVAEDTDRAGRVAEVQARIEALREAQERMSRPRGERIAQAIEEGRRKLEALEEQMFAIPDDQIATHIAVMEHRLEALREAQTKAAVPPDEQLATEIENSRRQLEQLEERMFYVAEDDELPRRIAALQSRIEELQRTREANRV
jgi:phytoene dehydrogenase-like protein